MIACPCCGTTATEILTHPSFHHRCASCSHRWRDANTKLERYYQSLHGRNAVPAADLARKLSDRLDSLRPFVQEGQRILEIGCAEGELGVQVKNLAGVHYVGVELSGDAERAEKVLDRVVRTSTTSLDDEPYDMLLAFHVLEHIPDVTSEVVAWRRLLTPRGIVVVEVPNEAGHPLLAWDANPEHIHQFNAVSLSALMQRCGFEVRMLTTGHFESPVYSDSVRLIARPTLSAKAKYAMMLERFQTLFSEPFAVYGIGGDFQNYVAPFLENLEVSALLDANPALHGQRIGALTVGPFEAAQHGHQPILISSYRYETEIRSMLIAEGVNPNLLFGLIQLYGVSHDV